MVPARPRKTREAAIPLAVLRAALRRAGPLRRRKGVVGLSIGMRRRDEAWVDGEPCISILVVEKHAREALRPGRALPPFIAVTVGGRSWKVPTDVRSTGGVDVGTCFGYVGSAVHAHGDPQVFGGISACVITTTQPKFLISGHVAARAGRTLVVDDVAFVTEQPVMTPRLDHCLARADFDLARASLPNDVAFKGLRDSASLAHGDELFVYRATTGAIQQVRVRHLQADARFGYASGVVRVHELIATDAVCVPGDSGCPLFDAEFLLVGTLLGGVAEDYYLPADYAFARLAINLPT